MSDLSLRANSRQRETRTFEFRLASSPGDGRTVAGLAAPFNSPTTIRDQLGEYSEVIRPGAFTRTLAERGDRIKLLAQHDQRAFPLGRIQRLWETPEGLNLESRIAGTTAGNDALALIREGIVSGLSIGFRPVRQEWNGDYSERQLLEVQLLEVSLVSEPAYADAGVTAVRSALQVRLDELNRTTPGSLSVALALRELDIIGGNHA